MLKSVSDVYTAKYDLDLALLHLQQATEPTVQAASLTIQTIINQEHSRHTQHPRQISFTIEFGKLIVSYWGEDFSESWRVTSYATFPNRLVLNITRQAGKIAGQLIVSMGKSLPLPPTVVERRIEFADRLVVLLRKFLPAAKILQVLIHQESDQPGHYARIWFKHQETVCLAIGVNGDELQKRINGLLGSGLQEFSQALQTSRPIQRILLFAPVGRSTTLAERLTLVTCNQIELYEVDSTCQNVIGRVSPAEQLALVTGPGSRYLWPKPHFNLTIREQAIVDWLVAHSPEHIAVSPSVAGRSLLFRWMGLEFAHLKRETATRLPVLSFGLSFPGEFRKPLTETNQPELIQLLDELTRHRTAQAKDFSHRLYRAYSERWLEAIIRHQIQQIDPRLDPGYVYAQAPAYSLDDSGYVDVLSVTQTGQLAVLELKAKEDRELPWQGLDYWQRVQAHARRGDFTRRGYFSGTHLNLQAPPLLFLIAPMLRFHETTKAMCRWIDLQVPLHLIGISEHWRQELKVIWRESN